MDTATPLAIRAVIRGLFHSDAINADQIRAVCAALEDAACAAPDRREGDVAKELLALRKGIRSDTAVR